MTGTTSSIVYTPEEWRLIVGLDKVSKPTVYKALHNGEIPSIRLGRLFFIPKSAAADHVKMSVEELDRRLASARAKAA